MTKAVEGYTVKIVSLVEPNFSNSYDKIVKSHSNVWINGIYYPGVQVMSITPAKHEIAKYLRKI